MSSSNNSPVTPPTGHRDDAWFQDAVAASIRLSNMQPSEKMQSHAEVFAGLSRQFQALASQCMTPPLDAQQASFFDSIQRTDSMGSSGSSLSTDSRSLSLSPVPELSSSVRQTPAPELWSAQDDAARELLKHALKRIPTIMAHASSLESPQWAPNSNRAVHLRAVSAQNCHGKTPSQKWLDRLFHICASQSYARDLRAYESRHGLKSKHETLVKRVNTRGEIQAHRISDHLSGYLGTRTDEADKAAVRNGLRFGVKLNVIEHVGEGLGFGHSFGLLFGYDNKRVFRLPYQSIISLQNAIRGDEAIMAQLTALSNKVDAWWKRLQARYHEHFTDGNSAERSFMDLHDVNSINMSAPTMTRSWSMPEEAFSSSQMPGQWKNWDMSMPMPMHMPLAMSSMTPPPWTSSSVSMHSYQDTPCATPFEFGAPSSHSEGLGLSSLGPDAAEPGYFDAEPKYFDW